MEKELCQECKKEPIFDRCKQLLWDSREESKGSYRCNASMCRRHRYVKVRYESHSDTLRFVNSCVQCSETLGTNPDMALDESVKVQVWNKESSVYGLQRIARLVRHAASILHTSKVKKPEKDTDSWVMQALDTAERRLSEPEQGWDFND